MTACRVVPFGHVASDGIADLFEGESGLLGFLGNKISDETTVALTDASDIDNIDPRYGYQGAAPGSGERLLSEILNAFERNGQSPIVLIQDPWALPSDYESARLKNKNAIIVAECPYVRVNMPASVDQILSATKSLVSTKFALFFFDHLSKIPDERELEELVVAGAVSAFDAQGWLFWARQGNLVENIRHALPGDSSATPRL